MSTAKGMNVIMKIINRINLSRNMYGLVQCNIYTFLAKYKNTKNSKLKKFVIMLKFFFSFCKVTQKSFEELCKDAYPILSKSRNIFTDHAQLQFKELETIFKIERKNH
ncbi:hypothetical protein [Clostridium sp. BJN0013]|uniref:hypothetical protein n=1 Tax=Clostridium sp. BJN0013 TaxID=3236840 RepID=UPI0034C66A8A